MEKSLAVSEIFGPTFQGEGPYLGRRCGFLRLAACNLSCVWCDTPYTWDWTGHNGVKYEISQEVHRMDTARAALEIAALKISMLVISGGEPMLQQETLIELLCRSPLTFYTIHMETAGTVIPHPRLVELVDLFNVSPKLHHSGNAFKKRYHPRAIDELRETKKAVWKFVAQQESDLEEVEEIVNKHQLAPVYIMPEGRDAHTVSERLRELTPAVLARGWNITTRLHIEIWGDKRGI